MRYTETSKKQTTIKFAYNQNRLANQKVNNVETAMTSSLRLLSHAS